MVASLHYAISGSNMRTLEVDLSAPSLQELLKRSTAESCVVVGEQFGWRKTLPPAAV